MFSQPWDSAAAAAQDEFPAFDNTFDFYRDNLGFPWAGQFPPNLPNQHYQATGHAQGIHSPIPHHPPYFFQSAAGMMPAAGDHQFPPAFNGVWGPDEVQGVAPGAYTEAWGPTPSDHHDPVDHSHGSLSVSQLSGPSVSATLPNHDLPHPQPDVPGTSASVNHNLPQTHASTSGTIHLQPHPITLNDDLQSNSSLSTIHLQPHPNTLNDDLQSHSSLTAVRLRRAQSSGTTRSRTSRRTRQTGIERGEAARQLNSQSVTTTPAEMQSFAIVPFNDTLIVSQAKDNMKVLLFGSSLFPVKSEIAIKAKDAWKITVESQPFEFQNLARSSAVSGEKKLVNMVEIMRNDLKEAARHFVYFKYSLTSSNTVSATGNLTGVEARVNKVTELIKDESFLDVMLNINRSRLVIVPFGNMPVLEFIAYVTYDSKFQYDQFLGKDSPLTVNKLRPLFLMSGTILRWALGERSKGIFAASEFAVDEWQTYHECLATRFDNMSPAQRIALEILVAEHIVRPY
ncbi:hypothetical protein F4604DRAFT_1936398 [Suillus subluteus]|nr:hypothetical protein F4604DRAFT_1936398 [Suillus subluteus]